MLRCCGLMARFIESMGPKLFGQTLVKKHGANHRIKADHRVLIIARTISTFTHNECPCFNGNQHNYYDHYHHHQKTSIPDTDCRKFSPKILHGDWLPVDSRQKSSLSTLSNNNNNNRLKTENLDKSKAERDFPRSSSSLSSNSDDDQNNGDLLSGKLLGRLVDNLPPSIRPYARLIRLDKPTGTLLLLLPCWWSIAMSTPAGSLPPLDTMAMFAMGAILMRSAGCVINDIWDRKYDRNVERTKNRPLATQEITIPESISLLSILLGSSLLILIQFDMNSILLGCASLALVASYPSFKRFTYYPQAVLGMTYSYGALLGWSVNCNGHLQLDAVIPLYVAGICWTMIYDTIYAHQDREHDLVLGLKSTAIKFGKKTKQILNAFSVLMTVCLLSCGLQTEQTWPYYVSLAIVFAKLLQINRKLDIDSMASCVGAFKQNTHIGWILLVGIIVSTLMKPPPSPAKLDGTTNMDDDQQADNNVVDVDQ